MRTPAALEPGEKRVKAYVAAPWEMRDEARRLAELMIGAGIEVTASWLFSDNEPSMISLHGNPSHCRSVQYRDREDIANADFLVVLSPEDQHRKGTGGRHVEFGIGMAWNKGLVVHGKPGNVFHYAPEVALTETDQDLLRVVGALKAFYQRGRFFEMV